MESVQVAPRELSSHYKAVRARLNKGRLIQRIPIAHVAISIPIPITHTEVEPLLPRRYPTVKEVVKTVAEFYKVGPLDIVSHARGGKKVCEARHVAMYLARTVTILSLPEIGRRMENRDHTTILYGVTKIERLMPQNAGVAQSVAELSAHFAAKYDLDVY